MHDRDNDRAARFRMSKEEATSSGPAGAGADRQRTYNDHSAAASNGTRTGAGDNSIARAAGHHYSDYASSGDEGAEAVAD